MSDSPDYDPVLLAWVTPIVTALADVVPAEQLMLVGDSAAIYCTGASAAGCRRGPPTTPISQGP